MTDPSDKETRRRALERAILNAQEQVSELLYRYKKNNPAIKHLGIYNLVGTLLAYAPDEEAVNIKLLEAQYDWLARMVGPAIGSVNSAHEQYELFAKRRVVRDFGRPTILRIGMEDGDAVSQIYAAPLDAEALACVVATARAATRRNAFVANETLLLGDLGELIDELRAILLGGG